MAAHASPFIQMDGNTFTWWMETTFCHVVRRNYALSLNSIYPGRVCVQLFSRPWMYGPRCITHAIVHRRAHEITIEGQWIQWKEWPDQNWNEPNAEIDPWDYKGLGSRLFGDIDQVTHACLRDAFGDLPIVKASSFLPHEQAKYGLYQTHEDGAESDEAFEYDSLKRGAKDWRERHAAFRIQRTFRYVSALRAMRRVFSVWFELSLRPDGSTGRRLVRDLSTANRNDPE